MKVIAITNRKGGTGKTTTATTLCQCLHRMGFRTLFIDLDEQRNGTMVLAPDQSGKTVIDLFNGTPVQECVSPCAWGDVIPASTSLAGYTPSRADMLKRALNTPGLPYDYVILDSPPSLKMTTLNALTACDGVVCPVQADMFSMDATKQLLKSIRTLEKTQNVKIQIYGILLCRYASRTAMGKQALDAFKKTAQQYGTDTFQATIRESVAIREAQAEGTDIFQYAKNAGIANDYRAFTAELLQRMNTGA